MPPEQATTTIADREAELTALQSSFDEYIESSRMLEEELDAELEKVQKQLSESNLANSNLMQQLENITPQLHQMEKALSKANAKLHQEIELRRKAELDQDEAEAKARACEGTIDALKEESDKAFQELAFREDEMDELKIMFEVEKEKHQEEMHMLRQELEDMRHNIHAEWKKKEQEQKELNGNGATDEIVNGTGAIEESEEFKKQLDMLAQKEEYIKSLEDELELVTEELIESNDERDRLASQMADRKRHPLAFDDDDSDILSTAASDGSSDDEDEKPNLDIMKETISMLEQKIEVITNETMEMKRELELSQEELMLTQEELQAAELDLRETTTKAESGLVSHKESLAELKHKLEEANVEAKSAKLEVETITNSFLDTNHKNTTLTEELEALNTALNNRKADFEALQEESVFLKKSFDDSKTLLTQKEERVQELVLNWEKAKNEVESLNSTLAKKEKSIESLERMEQSAKEDDSKLQIALDTTNLKLNNALVHLAKTREEVVDLKMQLKETQESLKNTNDSIKTNESEEFAKLEKDFDSLKDQHSISTLRIKKLEDEIHRLESELVKQEPDESSSNPPSESRFDGSSLLTDDLDKLDDEKVRFAKLLKSDDFVALKEEVKTLAKKSEMQREHNAQLLTKILRLQGNIQVCCRVRPMRQNEYTDGSKVGIEALSETEVGCFDKRTQNWKSYAFDKVWGPNIGQIEVYQDVEPLALSVVDGYNSCIFAYGQTGSGKTFTMEGSPKNHEYGVSYRIIQKLFNLLELKNRQHKKQSSNSASPDSQFEFSIEVGMLEIYNEDVFDLLSTETTTSSGRRSSSAPSQKPSLDIRRGNNNLMEIPGLNREKVECIQDVMNLLKRGNSNRATASTNLNEASSRSHMVLIVRVTSGIVNESQAVGNLFLVDLAGSERIRKSGVEGKEMKEAQHINKSLSALGNVMEALDRKSSHIPYRNSKLTYLLQDAFSGKSKTMMILTVCPSSGSFDETSTSLQFATRARRINLGVAQRNIKSKNLEQTVKDLTSEMKVLAKAKEAKEEQLNEMKKAHERIQERLMKSQESRNKVAEQESRTMAVLRKNSVEMVGRYQQEKASKEANAAELEQAQQQVRYNVFFCSW